MTTRARGSSRPASLLRLSVATHKNWRRDRTIRLGAGLAYYSIFTLIPLLALTAAMAAVQLSKSLFSADQDDVDPPGDEKAFTPGETPGEGSQPELFPAK